MKPVPGSPCQNCDFSYRCADDDQVCEEYKRWFGPWVRGQLRYLRKILRPKNFTAWRYYAPYEPIVNAPGRSRPEHGKPVMSELRQRLDKLDELYGLVPSYNGYKERADFAEAFEALVKDLGFKYAELARASNSQPYQIKCYCDGVYVPGQTKWINIRAELLRRIEKTEKRAARNG